MSDRNGISATRDDIVSSDLLSAAIETLKVLSEPARLQMLWALSKSEHSLSELAQYIGVSPAVAGQLLSKLRTGGVLHSRKDGHHVIYSLQDERFKDLISQVLDFAEHKLKAV